MYAGEQSLAMSGLPPLHPAFYTAKKVAERLGVARQELHGILPSHSHRFSRWRSSKEKEQALDMDLIGFHTSTSTDDNAVIFIIRR